MKNALSIDLEDWFCVHNLAGAIKRDDWDKCDLRVRNNTTRILNLLDEKQVKATFFVLGWVAERAPDLIQEVERRGHEIAVHGYNHLLLTEITPEEFDADAKKMGAQADAWLAAYRLTREGRRFPGLDGDRVHWSYGLNRNTASRIAA